MKQAEQRLQRREKKEEEEIGLQMTNVTGFTEDGGYTCESGIELTDSTRYRIISRITDWF